MTNETKGDPILLRYADLTRSEVSPMMQQYLEIKERVSDCLLFFRLGDFYELFFDDAIEASKQLEIALTSRDCGLEERAPMCGVPFHSANSYISKLIEADFKVAICEQMEEPSQAKGIVHREIVRIITPGTATDDGQLEEDRNSWILSLYANTSIVVLAAMELISGRFEAQHFYRQEQFTLIDEILRYGAKEILLPKGFSLNSFRAQELEKQLLITYCEEPAWTHSEHPDLKHSETEYLQEQKQRYSEQLGLMADSDPKDPKDSAVLHGALQLIHYIEKTQKNLPEHVQGLSLNQRENFLQLSESARRNLEIFESLRDRKKRGSLFAIMDHCKTSMGKRCLRNWLSRPLLDLEEIRARQDLISLFYEDYILREQMREQLQGLSDIERLCGKLSIGRINPRELMSLGLGLKQAESFFAQAQTIQKTALGKHMLNSYFPSNQLSELLTSALNENCPVMLKDGGSIRDGFDETLDRYRQMNREGRNFLTQALEQERENTGIKNLKLGYNRVFGYFFEVTKSQLNAVPDYFIRRQTLANAERFVTQELKTLESQILGADQKAIAREIELFSQIKQTCEKELHGIMKNADLISQLDVLLGLADVAQKRGYIRPNVDESYELEIIEGRHPVVEALLQDEFFVPNDLKLDAKTRKLILLTGPNMSGKSTYMRQVAQIVLLAQIGSFVPASQARIGLVDRIFTRIGAADDLGSGQSTFMVEMREIADILANQTERSLLILDEIGRGTSTYDGLSIAWAVIESVTSGKVSPRSLFATHYHELTDLEGQIDGLYNYHVCIREEEDHVIFLHRIEKGAANRSYGIEVARLAGVSPKVVARAEALLHHLEHENEGKTRIRLGQKNLEGQINLFQSAQTLKCLDDFVDKLKKIDVNQLNPIQALSTLDALVQEAQRK